MAFQIIVQPGGRQFVCDDDETILAAALHAGITIPYGCGNGACGTCKGKLLSGQVFHRPHQEKILSDTEKAQGYALFCCAIPTTDIVIEAAEIQGISDFPIEKLPVRIAHLKKMTKDIALLTLQLPAGEHIRYRAGQYLQFILKDNFRRSYSMADAPGTTQQITLHIRHMPGGLFTDQLFNRLKEKDILRIEAPLGTFFLRESAKPVIFVASGTGFAPIKAMIEEMIKQKIHRPVTLYWTARRTEDFYMGALCEEWVRTLPFFRYIPVLSTQSLEIHWSGRTGRVTQIIMEDFPDMSDYQVYACGAPAMIEAAQRNFIEFCRLPPEEFYADAFTSEADLAK